MSRPSAERRWFWLTAIGTDTPGIVAILTRAVADAGGNIEDAAMSRFHDWFAVMLLASFAPDVDAARALKHLQGQAGDLRIDIQPVTTERTNTVHSAASHRISVYGHDKPGVVATVAEALTVRGANIVALDVDVTSDPNNPDAVPLFVMVIDVAASDQLEGLAAELAPRLQMDVHVVPLAGIVL